MGRNVVELAANQEIDGQKAFEATFPATPVHEIMLEMDARRRGPPVCRLTKETGGILEIHPNPLRGREGRYSAQVAGQDRFTAIRVTTARDVVAQLVRVKLMGGAKTPAAGAPDSTSAPHA